MRGEAGTGLTGGRDPEEGRGERLNRYLARCGLGSRRSCEELIRAGRVSVDGRAASHPGVTVAPGQRVSVDGVPVEPQEPVYILLHKPPGYVTTVRDPRGRATVLDLVGPVGARLFPVGRLDRDAAGLLLLTNDGELAFRLTHPRFGVPRAYRALVRGSPSPRALARLRQGVEVGGRKTAPAGVRVLGREGDGTWLEITVHEGRYHQVKLMGEAVGYPVVRLIRVRMGPIRLGRLPPGRYRHLKPEELAALRRAVGLPGGAGRPRGSGPGRPGGRRAGQETSAAARITRPGGKGDGEAGSPRD